MEVVFKFEQRATYFGSFKGEGEYKLILAPLGMPN